MFIYLLMQLLFKTEHSKLIIWFIMISLKCDPKTLAYSLTGTPLHTARCLQSIKERHTRRLCLLLSLFFFSFMN